jgi:hypothetical protein
MKIVESVAQFNWLNLKRVLYILPLLLLSSLILFKNKLIEIQALFTLIITVMQLAFVIVILLYIMILIVKQTKFTLTIALLATSVFLVRYSDSLLSINFKSVPSENTISVMTWNLQRLGVFQRPEDNRKNIMHVIESIKTNNIQVAIEEWKKEQLEKVKNNPSFMIK